MSEQSDVQGEWFGDGFCVMAKPRFAAIARGIDVPMWLRCTHILLALNARGRSARVGYGSPRL